MSDPKRQSDHAGQIAAAQTSGPPTVGPSLPTHSLPGLTAAGFWGLVLTGVLLALSWYWTFADMWLRWFPAWYRYSDLSDRMSKGDSYYSHGPLVPLTSVILAFFIYKRVGVPVRRTAASNLVGWILLGGSLLAQITAVGAQHVMFLSGFALIGTLLGLLTVWGGWPLLKAYWLPVALLFFMVPLPMETIDDLNFRLKYAAGGAAVWLTNNVFNVPAILDGSYVHLWTPAGAPPKTLRIEDVCSGLRSLISLTFFASLFAMVCRVKGPWRLLLLVLAVPVAVVSNIVRITSMDLVANQWSVAAAGEQSWFHEFSGIMFFVVSLAILFGVEQAIIGLSRLFHRRWVDPRLLGYLDNIPPGGGGGPAILSPYVLGSLLAVVVIGHWIGQEGPAYHYGEAAARTVPRVVQIDGRPFTSTDLQLDAQTQAILETSDYLCRQYEAPRTARQPAAIVDLLIVFSQHNRKGTHPPEVCLKGAGEEIISKALREIPLADGQQLTMRELVSQRGSDLTYHLYVYKCGNRFTTSFFGQQAAIFFNGLIGRNSAGALIRFSSPVVGEDVEEARQQVTAAVGELMPMVMRNLP